MRRKGIICILLMALCGCGALNRPETIQNRASADIKDSRNKAYTNELGRATPDEEQSEDVEEFEQKSETTAERAKRIAHSVTELEGIEKASVVVSGNTAIVGINVIGELEDKKLIKLKDEVEQAVKNMDSSINHVAVTAAADLVQRITNMADSVAVGEKAPTHNSRIEEIIRNLTPPL